MRRSTRALSSRSQHAPDRTQGSGRRLQPWLAPLAALIGIVGVLGVVVYLVLLSGTGASDRIGGPPPDIECCPSGNLPGQFVNLPLAFAEGNTLAHYGAPSGPRTNAHVTHTVDYSRETSANSSTGFPPAGGPSWGQTTCGTDPALASAFCGPVPIGVYRAEWHPESLVNNMEQGGVIIWYNTSNTTIRDQIETGAKKDIAKGGHIVVVPYSNMPPNTVALTAWARRDEFPVSQLTNDRLDAFIKTFNCRFAPQSLCYGATP